MTMTAVDAEHITYDALQKFELILHKPDLTAFKETPLEAVYEAARSIERDQNHRNSLRNLRRIEPLLEGLRLLGQAIDIICPGFLCVNHLWVWPQIFDEVLSSLLRGTNQVSPASTCLIIPGDCLEQSLW